jgi:16S rRNA (adenine1518-N6/adenine1519-N6)-dimethyltransferase
VADPTPPRRRPSGRTRRPQDLTEPATVRLVARRAGLEAKHRLGQHFLVDRDALLAIVDALAPEATDTVWEIGPGIGTLTEELARRSARVVAVDLDPACIRAASATLRDHANVELVEADALSVDAGSLGLPDDHLATGNLPYNLTGALLGHLFEAHHPPRRAVFLVQREVAARIAAPPGGWSLSTVAIRSVATVERLGDIPPSSFLPQPAVSSSIIRLQPARQLDGEERKNVLDLARGAFQLRRKTLRHGMTRALGSADLAMAVLARCNIDAGRRPETLDLDEWRALAQAAGALR